MREPRSHGMFQPRVSAQPRDITEDRIRVGAWCARVLTLFPEMFPGPLGHSLIGKALKEGLWRLEPLDIRSFALDRHRTVDDVPFGGGPGMVMKPDIISAAIERAAEGTSGRERWPLIYLSPRGRPMDQALARRLAEAEGVTLLCGRYEGVDQRVLDAHGAEEVTVGDAVLTGGEIPAMALIDAAVRLRPGVLGNESSKDEESFSRGLLEHPQYTRPPVWEGRAVPEVLLSGHHARIAEWRHAQAEALTRERRPDLWRAHEQARTAAEQSDAETSPAKGAGQGGQKKDDAP